MRTMDTLMVRRMFFPGQVILEEGRLSDELFILVRGEVSKKLTGREVLRERASVHLTESPPVDVNGDGETPEAGEDVKEETDSEEEHGVVSVKTVAAAHCFGELGLLGIQPVASSP